MAQFDLDTDSMEFSFSADPPPAAKKATAKKKINPVGRPSSKASIEREMAEQISMIVGMIAMGVTMRDEHCGPVLGDQADEIGKALAAKAVDSPALMKWMEALTAPSGWIGIGMAFWPVAKAIGEHHVQPLVAKRNQQFEDMPQFVAG